MKSDGKLTQTDEETADVLINQFQSVFVDEGLDPISNVVESVIDMVSNSSAEPDGLKITFTVDQVRDKLLKLQENKSAGPDGFHPMVMRQCASELTVPLCAVFQESYESGQLPQDWKLANISAILRKAVNKMQKNYRPVSLTSVPGKTMESLIKELETVSIAKPLQNRQHAQNP